MMIDINDASQDAVFIHTENPNDDNFLIQFEKNGSKFKMANQLKEFIDSIDFEYFRHEWIRDNKPVSIVFLYERNVGVSIKAGK